MRTFRIFIQSLKRRQIRKGDSCTASPAPRERTIAAAALLTETKRLRTEAGIYHHRGQLKRASLLHATAARLEKLVFPAN